MEMCLIGKVQVPDPVTYGWNFIVEFETGFARQLCNQIGKIFETL